MIKKLKSVGFGGPGVTTGKDGQTKYYFDRYNRPSGNNRKYNSMDRVWIGIITGDYTIQLFPKGKEGQIIAKGTGIDNNFIKLTRVN